MRRQRDLATSLRTKADPPSLPLTWQDSQGPNLLPRHGADKRRTNETTEAPCHINNGS